MDAPVKWEAFPEALSPGPARPAPAPLRRRGAPRIEAPPLFVSGVPADVIDVSLGGICLRTRNPLALGQELDLVVSDGLCNFTTELRAQVVWCGRGRVGLRWLALSEAQLQWLRDRSATWLREGEVRWPQEDR